MVVRVKREKPEHKRRTIDWAAAQQRYIAANMTTKDGTPRYTYKDVAAEFGVHWGTVRNKAADQGWEDNLKKAIRDRDQAVHQKLVERNAHAMEVLAKEMANQEASVRRRHLNLSRHLQKLAHDKLQELKPEDITVRDAIELLKLGIGEERRALGMSDKIDVYTGDRRIKEFTPSDADEVLGEVIDLIKQEGDVFEQEDDG